MGKPREFWIITLGDFTPPGVMLSKDAADMAIELIKRSNDPNMTHVREVMEINWEKVWANYEGTERFDHIQIQELVEKQLRGEE